MNAIGAIDLSSSLLTALVPFLAAVLALQLFLIVFLWLRVGRLTKKYNAFMAGSPGADLETMLTELLYTFSPANREHEKFALCPAAVGTDVLNYNPACGRGKI